MTIDELFALTDEQRMERIQNMLWGQRDLDPAAADRETAFLLEKGRREPENGEVYELLADMENHIACSHHLRAEEYAKTALTRDPKLRFAHESLVTSLEGKQPDWCDGNHSALIAWYRDFLDVHPDCWRGYYWLLTQLIDAGRLAEAREYVGALAKLPCPRPHMPDFFLGLILWHEGGRDEALAVWHKMVRDFPDDWLVLSDLADALAMAGRYEEAIEWNERSKSLQTRPRDVTPQVNNAQLKELLGDIPGAVAELQEELDILALDHDTVTGETADRVRREIERLRQKSAAPAPRGA